MDNLELCSADRCEYNRSGYCGYYSVTGCQRPCKPGEKCDFFGPSKSEHNRKSPAKKKQASNQAPPPPKASSAVLIYVTGAERVVQVKGDRIEQQDGLFLIYDGDNLRGAVSAAEVYLIYIAEVTE